MIDVEIDCIRIPVEGEAHIQVDFHLQVQLHVAVYGEADAFHLLSEIQADVPLEWEILDKADLDTHDILSVHDGVPAQSSGLSAQGGDPVGLQILEETAQCWTGGAAGTVIVGPGLPGRPRISQGDARITLETGITQLRSEVMPDVLAQIEQAVQSQDTVEGNIRPRNGLGQVLVPRTDNTPVGVIDRQEVPLQICDLFTQHVQNQEGGLLQDLADIPEVRTEAGVQLPVIEVRIRKTQGAQQ